MASRNCGMICSSGVGDISGADYRRSDAKGQAG
jgi:hypothetical protein